MGNKTTKSNTLQAVTRWSQRGVLLRELQVIGVWQPPSEHADLREQGGGAQREKIVSFPDGAGQAGRGRAACK
jgi:hypothetical protein